MIGEHGERGISRAHGQDNLEQHDIWPAMTTKGHTKRGKDGRSNGQDGDHRNQQDSQPQGCEKGIQPIVRRCQLCAHEGRIKEE